MSSAASESISERALTPSLENYLKIIYREELAGGSALASTIADAAGVSRATVTSTLKALRSLGLIEYEAYKPITLTEGGRRIGQDLMHRHIIFREFFQHVLQFDEAQADAIAGEMSGTMPRHVVRRCGRFVLYMQKNKDFWKDWQNEYDAERDSLISALSQTLAEKASLPPEEADMLAQKYR